MTKPTLISIAAKQIQASAEMGIMKDKIHSISDKVDISEKKIDRILILLENDEKTNTKGIVQVSRQNTEDIQELKNFDRNWNTKLATAVGLLLFLSALSTIIINYEKIFTP